MLVDGRVLLKLHKTRVDDLVDACVAQRLEMRCRTMKGPPGHCSRCCCTSRSPSCCWSAGTHQTGGD
jgi:hypothetical protein